MKRGQLWTVSGGSYYTTKPRPVLIVQDDLYDHLDSILVCPFTTDTTGAEQYRPIFMPSDQNGLFQPSRAMVDKLSAIPRSHLGRPIGMLDSKDMARVSSSILVILGIAGAILTPLRDE